MLLHGWLQHSQPGVRCLIISAALETASKFGGKEEVSEEINRLFFFFKLYGNLPVISGQIVLFLDDLCISRNRWASGGDPGSEWEPELPPLPPP